MRVRKASALTREQFKQSCTHFHELQYGYCHFAHIRCDAELPHPCQRLFRYDLLYGDYKRKRPKGYNSPKKKASPPADPPNQPNQPNSSD